MSQNVTEFNTIEIREEEIAEFKASLRGELIQPEDPNFEEARSRI